MKVLVVGSNRDACIDFANALNTSESGGAAIIGGSEYPDAVGRLGKDVDAIAMLSEKPIADAIEANRNERVRAAVCRNAGDVRDAASCGANLFVISASDVQRHQTAAVAAMIGRSNGAHDTVVQDKRMAQPVSVKQPKKQDRDGNAAVEEDGAPGIMSRLRNIFGIE